jgi:hypothetical protein
MHLLAERFILGGDDRGFLKAGVKTYLMVPVMPLNSPIFFVFTSIVYGSEFFNGRSQVSENQLARAR